MLDAKVGDGMEELNGVYTPQLEKKLEVFDEYKRLVMEAADEVIEQVRKQAEQEAARIIGEASRKAKQIAEKTVANAEKAQYAILTESRAIARETMANMEQLTSALAAMQGEIDNLVGILGEQAHALTETTQKLETTIIDAKEKAHSEIAERLQAIQELNQKIKQVVEGIPRAGEKEVEHIGRDKEVGLASGEKKELVTQPTVSATQYTVSPPSADDRQFLGTVELVIISPNSAELRKKFLTCLPAAAGLDLQGPPESVGKKRTQTVYLPKPVPLVKILRQMAMVKSANEDGRGIIEIVLEAVDQWRG